MKSQQRILYCGPEDSLFKKLSHSASDLIWQARQTNFSTSPQKFARQWKANVLLLKVKNEFDLKHQEWLSKNNASVPVIIVCQSGSMEMAIQAVQSGAFDYFCTSQSTEMIVSKVREALASATTRSQRRHSESKNQVLLGNHPSIVQINERAQQMAQDRNPVLITGEAGTGKEHLAYGIYRLSGQRSAPFLRYDCRTLLEMSRYDGQPVPQLIQSGVRNFKKRSFPAYVFLSHVEYLPPDELTIVFERRAPAVKIFASLEESRPSLFPQKIEKPLPSIDIPSLRHRKEDIPVIAEHFVKRFSVKRKVRSKAIADDVFILMQDYSWPGNIQELSNVIERMMLLEPSKVLTATTWRLSHGNNWTVNPDGANQFSLLLDEVLKSSEQHWKKGMVYDDFMAKMEKMLIDLVLPQVNFNQAIAANILGISRNTLRERLKAE